MIGEFELVEMLLLSIAILLIILYCLCHILIYIVIG